MNKIGLSFGYLRGTAYENDVLGAMELVRRTGCESFNIPLGCILPMDVSKRREVAQRAKALDLELSITGSMTGETDIASDDAAIRDAGVEFGKRALQACYDIGAAEWGGLNTAEEGLSYVLEAGSPRAMIILDTFHMNIEEDSILDAMELVQNAGKLANFHVGEANRRIPGTGRTGMDWAGIFSNLRAHGYTGCVLMEPFVRMDLPSSKNTCSWRNLTKNTTLEEYMKDVETGYRFIRAALSK